MGTSSQDRLRGTRYIVMGWGGVGRVKSLTSFVWGLVSLSPPYRFSPPVNFFDGLKPILRPKNG